MGYRSLRSLRTHGFKFRFYLDLLCHMDDCHQEAGGERLKGVHHIIAITKKLI